MNKWMIALVAFAFGLAVGMGIAVYIAMRVNMMNFVYPATMPIGWLIA